MQDLFLLLDMITEQSQKNSLFNMFLVNHMGDLQLYLLTIPNIHSKYL